MAETKRCSCGGAMRDLGKRQLNLADSILIGNSIFSFEAVRVYVCESCRKLEFYSLDRSVEPEVSEGSNDQLYDTYKDVSTSKLEKILEKDDYTDECKAVIRRILSERH